MSDKRKPKRVLIVFDGEAWFLRRLVSITHDLDRDEKLYRCDKHLGGPWRTLTSLVAAHDSRLRKLYGK